MSAYEIAKSFTVKPKSLSVSFSFASNNDRPKTYKTFTQQFENLEEMKAFVGQIVTDYVRHELIFLPSCKSPIFFHIQEIEYNQNKKFGVHLSSSELRNDKEAFQQRIDMLIEEVWQALITKKPIKNDLVIVERKETHYGNKVYLGRIIREYGTYCYRSTLEEVKVPIIYYYIISNNFTSNPVVCREITN